MSSRRITIFDTTLRDGEQAPGIALRPDEKVEIGGQLERLGVDVIEAGFAASSPGDFEGVRAVAQAVKNVTVASLCRTSPTDIDASAAALEDAPRSRAHIFLATSELHMAKKLRMTPEQVVANAKSSVTQAAATMDEVEFSCEDATRSDPEFVARVCRTAIEAGATTINLPDTVGYLPALGVHRLPPQRPPQLSRARRRGLLGALPRRSRPGRRQLARGARRRCHTARGHDQRHRRARRQCRARGDRDGAAGTRGRSAVPHERRPRADCTRPRTSSSA